jgi:acetyl/propionyl-CoA carboxylase alpha subunit
MSARAVNAAARAVDPVRHAIEVRLSAEDPARDFAPAPGRIGRWIMPGGPGVRVDSGVSSGDRVPPDYDPLVAKLMVVAEDRPRAIARLRRALDEVEVTGIQTTLPFHRVVAHDEAFGAGELSTDWVADHWDPTVARHRATALAAAAEVAARAFVAHPSATASDLSLRKDTGLAGDGPDDVWKRAGREDGIDRWPR